MLHDLERKVAQELPLILTVVHHPDLLTLDHAGTDALPYQRHMGGDVQALDFGGQRGHDGAGTGGVPGIVLQNDPGPLASLNVTASVKWQVHDDHIAPSDLIHVQIPPLS